MNKDDLSYEEKVAKTYSYLVLFYGQLAEIKDLREWAREIVNKENLEMSGDE